LCFGESFGKRIISLALCLLRTDTFHGENSRQ
jgi:hypothetical protein